MRAYVLSALEMQGQHRPRRRFALQGFFPPRRRKGASAAAISLNAVRTTLELVECSADVCPPLKSAVGAVVAICKLADRIAASDADAGRLAWRAVTILDAIYNSIDAQKSDAIPPHLLNNVVQFEQLLIEIHTAMKGIKTKGIRRLLHLRRNESQLATFNAQLDAAAQVFTIGTMTSQTVSLAHIDGRMQSQAVSLAHIQEIVEKVSTVSSALEHSNVQLRGQVRFLQITTVFLG
ncbi:hypothetical protein B0H17DRAFT_1072228 [Mycena rosella]|uniref:Uncharacterized protein n=1 Tax=Mycena rosella TaxID=1033263 RepID=A0AAD7D9L6_MYCRO|nr:hypothetical protein B0H17DRAFT_1072228 [Mycena rosella]